MKAYSVCGLTPRGSRICVNVKGSIVRSVTTGPAYQVLLKGDELVVLPAAIDMHVHLRGLRLAYKEDPGSGTRAAAAGGIAVVADMPNTIPPARTLKALKEKMAELDAKSIVDYVLYAGVPEQKQEALVLARQPIAGFKVYPEDLTSPTLCEVLRQAASHGKLVVLHPEHPDAMGVEEGWPDARNEARPCYSEVAAVDAIAEAARRCGLPRIHVTHASCPETVTAAKRYGFTVDVTPHHLLLALTGGPALHDPCLVKVNPPLRGLNEALHHLKNLLTGFVDAIASDHAPHAAEEKGSHPLLCPPGIASLEHWVPLVASLFSAAGALDMLWPLVSERPAAILGLRGRGRLEPGAVADIVVLKRDGGRLAVQAYSKAPTTPYVGLAVGFEVEALVVRGTPVYMGSEGILVEEGFGVNALAYRLVEYS